MGCIHPNINGGPLQSVSQDIFSTNYVGPEVTTPPYYTHAVLYKTIFNGLSGLKLCQYCSWKRKGWNRSQLYCRFIKALYIQVIILWWLCTVLYYLLKLI